MAAAVPTPADLSPPEGDGALRRHRLNWTRVYLVCEGRPNGEDPESLLRAALSSGAGMVELRDRELPRRLLRVAAETFARMAETYNALFIVNDDPHLAAELDADGVHVGQEDVLPAEARRILGPDAIIGLSTHTPEQIEASNSEPVDYISVGPIWETPTKEGRPATGLDLIRTAASTARRPWFAIGGIDHSNVGEVLTAGAERICVVRAIRDAADPAGATSSLAAAVASRRQRER